MKKTLYKGFTLIELLIVMAILGVLAVVVLVAINPAEQLARTRDAGRSSAITQLGHAVQAYYTSRSEYPPKASWGVDIVAAGEMTAIPDAVVHADGATCGTSGAVNDWCYDDQGTPITEVIIYTKLESTNNTSRCTGVGELPYMLYSAALGRGGIVCSASEPTASAATPPAYTFE